MSKPIEASIVVVDDEPSIRELLVASLHFAGFEVNTAASGSEAIEVIERLQPDLIVLDVMLPDIDGFTVTRRIRQEGITTPVLYLTARDDTQDKVMGLTVGGDDYVTKPFSIPVLLEKIRVILRRGGNADEESRLRYRDLSLDLDAREALLEDRPLDLTAREFELLHTFLAAPGRVFTREMLLAKLWGYDFYGDERVVDSHIKNLRHTLGRGYIQTVRGVGYRAAKEGL